MESNLEALLKQFIPGSKWNVKQGKGGVNNTTRFVETAKEKYVLRIYETHRDMDKVKYEHSVLSELEKTGVAFGTPRPVKGIDNQTVKYTEDGRLAALFSYMEGITPVFDKPRQLYSFGLTTAKLTCTLVNIKTELAPVYRPYYEIENTHPKCSVGDVIRFCEMPSPEFTEYKAELLEVAAQLKKFRENLTGLRQLPHQLIHGDLNASNVLADTEGNICAVLDFEFVTEDLRVMELCVCLSEIINMEQTKEALWEKLRAFLEGYGTVLKLTGAEISVIPLLIMLRRLDVFIHFLGRFRDGIDRMDIVIDQMKNVAAQARWLEAHEHKIMAMCCSLVGM
ncbi:MAG: aminoglycoside phosphotransferase [Eubacterium sp.]|jgi:homoserine kinase type II|nr:aminoglycoside phosphotransferase [Eubacterium sp.]